MENNLWREGRKEVSDYIGSERWFRPDFQELSSRFSLTLFIVHAKLPPLRFGHNTLQQTGPTPKFLTDSKLPNFHSVHFQLIQQLGKRFHYQNATVFDTRRHLSDCEHGRIIRDGRKTLRKHSSNKKCNARAAQVENANKHTNMQLRRSNTTRCMSVKSMLCRAMGNKTPLSSALPARQRILSRTSLCVRFPLSISFFFSLISRPSQSFHSRRV